MEDDAPTQSMLELARAIWARRQWIAVLAFAGPLVAALSVLAFMPRLYEAKATVLVEREQLPESLVKPTVSNELELRLHAIHQEVLSRARLEKLIGQLDLYPDIRSRQGVRDAVDRLRRAIKLEKKTERSTASREPTTVSFVISYRDPDPQKAADVTNALARTYVETNASTRERQANANAAFLKIELAQAKGRLDEHEKRVTEYKRQNGGALPDQVQFNMLTVERLYSELRMNRDAQGRLQDRAEQPGPAGGIDLPPAQDRAAARLTLLRQELADLSTHYTDRYPDVIHIKQEIAQLEQQVARAPKRAPVVARAQAPARPFASADSRLGALQAEEQRLLAAIAMYQKRIEEAPGREQALHQMARDFETAKDLYRSLKQRYDEALLGESMEQQKRGEMFRIIEPATPPDQPAAPRTGRLGLLALVAALGISAVAVLVAEHVDTSFHSLEDLRLHVAAPVAAAIPLIVTAADVRRRRRRRHLLAACSTAGLVMIVGLAWLLASGNYELVSFLALRG